MMIAVSVGKIDKENVEVENERKKNIIQFLLGCLLLICLYVCNEIIIKDKENPETTNVAESESAGTQADTENIITGNRFICLDDSEIQMKEDGSFIYYRTKEDYGGDYYQGTYEVYWGQEAVDKIVSMEEYGLTEEELERTINANKKGYHLGDISGKNSIAYMLDEESYSDAKTYDVSKDVFYCIILHNDILYMDGQTKEMNQDSIYIGYYVEEVKTLDLLNIVTVSPVTWTLQ